MDAGAGDKSQGNLDKYMAQLAPIIAQIAGGAGIINPQTGQAPGNYNPDPYSLAPGQQAELNQEQSLTAEEYRQIGDKAKANLISRGMGDSSAMTAVDTYLRTQASTRMGQERIQAGQDAYGNKQNALQQISQLLSGGYQEQQKVTDKQGQTAVASHQEAMSQLGKLLSIGLYAGGVGPFGASKGGGAEVAGIGGGGDFTGSSGMESIGRAMGNTNWGSIY